MRCYKVKVETINILQDTFWVEIDDKYYNCENGIIYIVTDDPREIYRKFNGVVKSVEDIGVGYIL